VAHHAGPAGWASDRALGRRLARWAHSSPMGRHHRCPSWPRSDGSAHPRKACRVVCVQRHDDDQTHRTGRCTAMATHRDETGRRAAKFQSRPAAAVGHQAVALPDIDLARLLGLAKRGNKLRDYRMRLGGCLARPPSGNSTCSDHAAPERAQVVLLNRLQSLLAVHVIAPPG
jgi:hypothetical protein